MKYFKNLPRTVKGWLLASLGVTIMVTALSWQYGLTVGGVVLGLWVIIFSVVVGDGT
jgi:hypothetical protein